MTSPTLPALATFSPSLRAELEAYEQALAKVRRERWLSLEAYCRAIGVDAGLLRGGLA